MNVDERTGTPETTAVEAGAMTPEESHRLSRLKGPNKDYVLSVLIPVYNERETLLLLLDRVRDVEIKKEIILVDDGSTDGTRDLLREQIEGRFPDVKVFYHAA